MYLCGGELVRVAAVDLDHQRVARSNTGARVVDPMLRQDLLGHGLRRVARARPGQLDLARRDSLREREQTARSDLQLGDRVVVPVELLERDPLPRLQPLEQGVIAHQHTLVDVVGRVDRRERGGDRDPDAPPLLGLNGGFAGAADPLAQPRHDHFEVAVDQRVALEQPLAVDDQAGVGVARQILRPVREADPRRRHGIRVDVVEQLVDRQVAHAQIQLAAQLATDQLGILGQKQRSLVGREAYDLRWSHLFPCRNRLSERRADGSARLVSFRIGGRSGRPGPTPHCIAAFEARQQARDRLES